MSQHDLRITLQQMRDHAAEAAAIAAKRSRQDLSQDRLLNLGLTRLVEIVGEAATRVPPDAREKMSSIPWTNIISTRNRLIHAYDRVEEDVLWQIVRTNLPALVSELDRILAGKS